MPDKDYDDIVGTAVVAAVATGPLVLTAPPVDMAAMAAIWATMTGGIARRARHELDGVALRKLMVAVIVGGGAYWAGSKIALTIGGKLPVTLPAAMAINSALNGIFTIRVAHAMIDLVEKPDFEATDSTFMANFIGDVLKPRPSASELQRLLRLWRRFRDN